MLIAVSMCAWYWCCPCLLYLPCL